MNYHQSLPSSSVPSVFKPSHKKSLLQLYRQLRHEVEDAFTKPTVRMEEGVVVITCVRKSEQGNVIWLVSVYICVCVQKKFVI